MLQVTKSEGSNNATTGDSAESLAEDLLKRFSDSQPDIKKEPANSKCMYNCSFIYKQQKPWETFQVISNSKYPAFQCVQEEVVKYSHNKIIRMSSK